MKTNLETYIQVQKVCRDVLSEIGSLIKAGQSELEIVNYCRELIAAYGVHEYWYHNIPVMVALGQHTMRSATGKGYVASDQLLADDDYFTIDLSLAINNHWGIYAKTFSVESGMVRLADSSNDEFVQLKNISETLHHYLLEIAHPDMTFHELYHAINARVISSKVLHLDFRGNFGHSIEQSLDARVYIENNSMQKISQSGLFGFEPHLRFIDGRIGFKDADIYFFKSNKLHRLSEAC